MMSAARFVVGAVVSTVVARALIVFVRVRPDRRLVAEIKIIEDKHKTEMKDLEEMHVSEMQLYKRHSTPNEFL